MTMDTNLDADLPRHAANFNCLTEACHNAKKSTISYLHYKINLEC